MRITLAVAAAAAILVGACGGGQTGTTEAEDALANDLQPAAPSPGVNGVAAPGGGGGDGGAANGAPAASANGSGE